MIAGHVTVFECDICHAITSIRNDEEFNEFESTWHTDILHDFCPNCKNSVIAKIKIRQVFHAIMNALKDVKTEVLDAEYIN